MIDHLYVHVPFCAKICPYCNFYKSPAAEGGFQEYVDAVLAEARGYEEMVRPRTVFFGGGTPTALSVSQLRRLIGGLRKVWDFSGVEEFTIEINPATVSPSKAGALLECGVTRASVGVQSWEPHLLERLGRTHTAELAARSLTILREAGFSNINIDLMFGVPGQTVGEWESTVRRTIDEGTSHVSAYLLTYEEDTEYFLRLARGEWSPDPALDAELFELTARWLASAGLPPYETSNFARPGSECRHNRAIWHGADYLGLGPGAVSTVGGVRWQNIPDTAAYRRRVEEGKSPAENREELTPQQLQMERLALGLRTREGVDATGLEPEKVDSLIRGGHAIRQGSRLVLTASGRALADEVALALI
ncbi:MAG: radical SAM family heme chaperone HemW [Terrimicrobiaceae bacterium]